MICRIWNFVAFIGIVPTSTDYKFKPTTSSILRGERYSNRHWFLFTCGFVAHSVVWERLGSFCSQGERLFDKNLL